MARDSTIERVFTAADDALQGLWGLHRYTDAAIVAARRDAVKMQLPDGLFQITHEWRRYYDREQLLTEMRTVFGPVHCRQSLVAAVAIFEAAVTQMHTRVNEVKLQPNATRYFHKLKWVFGIVRDSNRGSETMIKRLPDLCGDVDNARRLRNCIVHNNGSYNAEYLGSAIEDGWTKVKELAGAREGVNRNEKILLTRQCFEELLRSHIELLHILHNTIQFNVFHHDEDYNYAKEEKAIEWHRILSGNPAVRM